MRLKFIAAVILVVLCTSASAQLYKEDYVISKDRGGYKPNMRTFCGVMAGVSVPILADKAKELEIENNVGYNIGMMWGMDFGSVEITPEIWYQHYKINVYDPDTTSGGDIINNSIEMPIIVALKFGNIRFNFGPSLSLMSSSKIDAKSDESIDFGNIKSTGGYIVGLSLTLIDHVIIDARYTGRFVSTKNEWYNGGGEHEYRYSSCGVNVGYRF
ncbi:MAG: hypothetical protein SNF68_01130 [Rikenellaceae bacterium]